MILIICDLVSMTSDVLIETLKSINIELVAHGSGAGGGNDDNIPINMLYYIILYNNNNTTIRHFSSDCTATFWRSRTIRHPG